MSSAKDQDQFLSDAELVAAAIWPGETTEVHPTSAENSLRLHEIEAAIDILIHEIDGGADPPDTNNDLERRRAVDRILHRRLLAERYEGTVWRELGPALLEYATPVLKAWFYNKKIFELCADRHRSIGNGPKEALSEDDCSGMVFHVTAKALAAFRSNGRSGNGWIPDGGASIATYFVNGCIFEVPNVYRAWEAQQKRIIPAGFIARGVDPESISGETSDATSHDAIAKLRLSELIRRLPNRYAEVFPDASPEERLAMMQLDLKIAHMRGEGYSFRQIAESVGLPTGRAAEARFYRFRRNIIRGGEL